MASAAPPPASDTDALDMVLTGLRYLNAADPAAMATEQQTRLLKTLEQVHAMGTAAHAQVLGAFTARQGYAEDGEYSPRSWLIHQGDITRAAAFAHTPGRPAPRLTLRSPGPWRWGCCRSRGPGRGARSPGSCPRTWWTRPAGCWCGPSCTAPPWPT